MSLHGDDWLYRVTNLIVFLSGRLAPEHPRHYAPYAPYIRLAIPLLRLVPFCELGILERNFESPLPLTSSGDPSTVPGPG